MSQATEAVKAVPLRHPWRWVSGVIVLAITGGIVYTIVTAPSLNWNVVWAYLFQDLIFKGVLLTLELTAIAMAIGVGLGVVLAVMRLSPNPVVSSVSWFYIWFFRGTPVLVQIFFWYNLNAVLPHIGIGIPFTHIGLQASTNTLISPLLAVILGLGLNEAAYMAEIVRAGIISVEHGQTEAAQALGMRRLLVMRRIVLPQAMRVIIPPTGNETISMLKTSSLAFIAAVPELFTRSEQIASANFDIIELLFVASAWYLAMTSILTLGQYYVERYYARGSQRELPPTPLQRFRRVLFTFHAQPPVPLEAEAPLSIQRRG
ncbi:MAG TPA: amino acid ABC transporter permease [Candidatus Acidoferrales bacterium]|nr:amino acid ABC transporter permease [Candidatus Acidoferrales bacterium]